MSARGLGERRKFDLVERHLIELGNAFMCTCMRHIAVCSKALALAAWSLLVLTMAREHESEANEKSSRVTAFSSLPSPMLHSIQLRAAFAPTRMGQRAFPLGQERD